MTTKTIIDVIVILKDRLKSLAPDADAQTVAYIVSSIEKLELQISAMMLIEFGEQQVEKIKTESASGILLIAGMLATEGVALKTLVESSAKSLKTLATEKTLAYKSYAETVTADQLLQIQQAGQSLIKQNGAVLENANPFIFGVMKRCDCMGMGYTSEYGAFNGNNFQKPFEALTGINQDRRFKNFEVPLSMQFIKGDNWGFQKQKTEYACSGSLYQYPSYIVSAIFLHNKSESDINKTFKSKCSNHWSSGYEGIQINQATPVVNADGVTTVLNWKQLATNTSSSANRDTSATITIPAKTTIAVVLSNARHYQTSSNGYQFYYQHEISGFNAMLDDNISIDHAVTQNALQLNTTKAFEFWNTQS